MTAGVQAISVAWGGETLNPSLCVVVDEGDRRTAYARAKCGCWWECCRRNTHGNGRIIPTKVVSDEDFASKLEGLHDAALDDHHR